jgi:hypothetical protein
LDTSALKRLSELLETRNGISRQITAVTGRPAQIGHLGEFIASQVFDIALESSAANKGFDGRFRSGLLAGRTVDVKWYAKKEGLVDLRLDSLPDYYLVFTGPPGPAATSRGEDRPWLIEAAYLFSARPLVDALRRRAVKIGVATSVAQEFWSEAQVYPTSSAGPLVLTREQCEAIALFGSKRHGGPHPVDRPPANLSA